MAMDTDLKLFCAEDNYKDAKQRLKEYRENERGIFRVKKKREKK